MKTVFEIRIRNGETLQLTQVNSILSDFCKHLGKASPGVISVKAN